MSHPYNGLPSRAFWRSAIGDLPTLEIGDLWRPKFTVGKDEPVATLGSCFAQHISRAMVDAGFSWLNAEPAPPRFPEALKTKFHYDVFSARVGNVYTVALLRQWVLWAFDLASPPAEVWREGDRYYDPFRPNVEPNGFASEQELRITRAQTIRALRSMFKNCHVFIFTLGLTEAWINSVDDSVYPMCPGTFAGSFRPNIHHFKNYTYPEIYADLCNVISIIQEYNPSIKFIFTVSPVPLTATASGEHVLVSTVYSKSVLRAVAGAVTATADNVDYFPSYEIISSFPFKGIFYDTNLRTVTKEGVSFVMRNFLSEIVGVSHKTLQDHATASSAINSIQLPSAVPVDEVCEEMILEAYGR